MTTTREEKARSIVRRLREEGYQALLAGGCVRDMLLGITPKDYDVATDAPPESTRALFPKTAAVGSKFGSIVVIVEEEPFEVTTFRSDGPYLDGRHPSKVRFGTLEEDVRRRDFTINAMMFDPQTRRLIDLVGGQEDLQRGVVRAVGDPTLRFAEDRLRMLRAVRLAAALNFTIHETTHAAIQQQVTHITDIAQERIGGELTRLLVEGGAARGVTLLDSTGLLAVLLPEVEAMKGVPQSPDYHPEGDVFVHTIRILEHLDSLGRCTETLAYGALLHDVGKPACLAAEGERITFYGHPEKGAEMAVEILSRLKRSRSVSERVAYLVRSHLRYVQAPKMRLSTLKRFLREEGVEELLELCRLDALSSNGDLTYYRFCKETLSEYGEDAIRPPPLIRGRDLIQLGYNPGPLFSKILRLAEEAQLEGELTTKEQAAEWVRANWPLEC